MCRHRVQSLCGELRPSFEFEKIRSQKNCMSDESETSHWYKLRCEPSAGENTIRMHTYRTEANKRNCRRDMVSMRYGLHETCMWCYSLSADPKKSASWRVVWSLGKFRCMLLKSVETMQRQDPKEVKFAKDCNGWRCSCWLRVIQLLMFMRIYSKS